MKKEVPNVHSIQIPTPPLRSSAFGSYTRHQRRYVYTRCNLQLTLEYVGLVSYFCLNSNIFLEYNLMQKNTTVKFKFKF